MTIGRRGFLLAAASAAFVLGGAGSATAASIDPPDFDFGNQDVGTTSVTKTFTVNRDQLCFPGIGCFGPDPTDSLTPVGVTGPFAVTPSLSCILFVPSCTVDVTFLPVAGGLANGTLTGGDGSAVLRGTGVAQPVLQQAQASNLFSFGKLKLNKKKGTATLTIDVPGPGNLALGGKGVVKQRGGTAAASKAVSKAGKVTLRIKAKGKKKAKLIDTGKVKVKPKVTFSPTGGTPATQTRRITLKKNL